MALVKAFIASALPLGWPTFSRKYASNRPVLGPNGPFLAYFQPILAVLELFLRVFLFFFSKFSIFYFFNIICF